MNILDKLSQRGLTMLPTAQLEGLQAKWRLLGEKDRFALKGLGIFAVLLLCWLIITPFVTWVQHKQAAYTEARALLVWMHGQEPLARQAAAMVGGSGGESAQSLLATINAVARNRQVAVKRFEPDGEHAVRLWLENVRYDAMVLWLYDLAQQKKIHVKQITINKQIPAGYVSGTIIFGS